MSPITDKDKYVIYHGIEDGTAIFSLYVDGGIVRRVTMSPEDVPTGTEIQDHFWVKMENSEVVDMEFYSEFTLDLARSFESANWIYSGQKFCVRFIEIILSNQTAIETT